jgi:preprotein translocase subunit SecA
MNDQRKVIFEQRLDIMGHDDVSETVKDMRQQIVDELVATNIPENAYAEQWKTKELKEEIGRIFSLDLPVSDWAAEEGIADQEIRERVMTAVEEHAAVKDREIGADNMRQIEKMVLLQTLDHLWREHLVTLEHLRQVIGFRAYGQRDPVNEYKSEAFILFENMLVRLREATVGQLMHIELAPQEQLAAFEQAEPPPMQAHHINPLTGEDELALVDAALAAEGRPQPTLSRAPVRSSSDAVDKSDPSTWGKVSRNNPCGSGKKYKHCHGRHDN